MVLMKKYFDSEYKLSNLTSQLATTNGKRKKGENFNALIATIKFHSYKLLINHILSVLHNSKWYP